MKYIITESQLDRATDAFLTLVLEPDEVKKDSDNDTIVWFKKGKKVAIIQNNLFLTTYNSWKLFSEMFNINDNFEIQSYVKKWLDQHHNLGEVIPTPQISPYGGMMDIQHNLRKFAPTDRIIRLWNSWDKY